MANAKGEAPADELQQSTEEEVETEVGEEESEGTPPDTSEEDEGEEGESEEETVEQYFEISKVPPSLQGMAKKMQATHTRKMQGLAQQVRMGLALTELMKHPNWEPFIKDIEARNPYGGSAAKQSSRQQVEDDSEGEETETSSSGRIDMKKLISSLTPAIKQMVEESIAPLMEERANTDWKRFSETHPDLDDYRPDIVKIMREHPGISLKRAYNIAKSEDDEVISQREASRKPKKPNRTEKPTSSKNVGLSPETSETLEAALKGAMRQQGFRV